MLKLWILACAICLAGSSPLCAAETIQVEKLTNAQLQEALKAAPDDTIIDYQGIQKTKAQLRSELQAQHKPFDPEKTKEAADQSQAKFQAAAKALNDQQDAAVAAENAAVDAEFEKLKARETPAN
jgi:hypothetical protein